MSNWAVTIIFVSGNPVFNHQLKMILVFLQNAWAKDKRSATLMERNKRIWLYATAKSRSGIRLKTLLGSDCFSNPKITFANTTPKVGIGPSSQFPSDQEHIDKLLIEHKPKLVIACGTQASTALSKLWNGDLLCVPHPAYRVVTNALYRMAKNHINNQNMRLKFEQAVGEVIITSISND